MRILVSNDDGYRADGIGALRDELAAFADVTLVAPDRNRSGASNSLTLDVPLRVQQVGEHSYCVPGTPTDCVHLAISGLFAEEFDLVASGVNDGENLGDDVLYSGTVAAAVEGRFLGLPTIAVSLVTAPGSGRNFAAAARVARQLVETLAVRPLDQRLILNVNVPDLPHAQLRGMKATRLGNRHRSEPALEARDPRGRKVWWIGPSGDGADAGEGTDFHAVANGWVSVTPLQIDLTRHSSLAEVAAWLTPLK